MADKRGLTNRVAIGNAIDKDLYNRLKAYSQETDIPFSRLLDRAIRMFLESVGR